MQAIQQAQRKPDYSYRGFKPGVSGNPGGRPKQRTDLTKLARKYTKTALLAVVRILKDPESGAANQLRAAEILLDRGHGKAPQVVTLDGDSSAPVDLLEVARRVAFLLAYAEREQGIAQAQGAIIEHEPSTDDTPA